MTPASLAAQISPNELVQYQHEIDVADCNIKLSDGSEILFSGLFANTQNQVVFHEILTLVIPTGIDFSFGTIVSLKLSDQ
jgi:hypothetical protein